LAAATRTFKILLMALVKICLLDVASRMSFSNAQSLQPAVREMKNIQQLDMVLLLSILFSSGTGSTFAPF
jgi:hypothetical protein